MGTLCELVSRASFCGHSVCEVTCFLILGPLEDPIPCVAIEKRHPPGSLQLLSSGNGVGGQRAFRAVPVSMENLLRGHPSSLQAFYFAFFHRVRISMEVVRCLDL